MKRLNEQVRRNLDRFPSDFMIQLSFQELSNLRSQIATFNDLRKGRKYRPFVFTENGVAMLSSVLRSKKAIQVNIEIMRIFTRLRSYLLLEKDLSGRMDKLEIGTNKMFKVVFERLDNLEDEKEKPIDPNRKIIKLR